MEHADDVAPDIRPVEIAMKVAMVNLTHGGMSGGYHKYLRSLVPLLRDDVRIARLDVFLPSGLPAPDEGPVHRWDAGPGASAAGALSRQLRELRPDVLFFPTARSLRYDGPPAVIMVRNMEPLTRPFGGNTWHESLRNLARARAARAACRRASRIIAVSQHVQHFVVNSWGIPAERVALVYHGVEAPGASLEKAPEALAGLKHFVFTAGSVRPARGLEDLIGAAPALLRSDPALKIVIAGRSDPSGTQYERRMRQLAARLGVAGAIAWVGHLEPMELSWAYQHCAAFVVTSRVEACPNVALEAMSHCGRIVSTSEDPLPEFFGEVATYYRAGDATALAMRLLAVLAASTDAEGRTRAATERAGTFTWKRTANQTVDELRRAAESAR